LLVSGCPIERPRGGTRGRAGARARDRAVVHGSSAAVDSDPGSSDQESGRGDVIDRGAAAGGWTPEMSTRPPRGARLLRRDANGSAVAGSRVAGNSPVARAYREPNRPNPSSDARDLRRGWARGERAPGRWSTRRRRRNSRRPSTGPGGLPDQGHNPWGPDPHAAGMRPYRVRSEARCHVGPGRGGDQQTSR